MKTACAVVAVVMVAAAVVAVCGLDVRACLGGLVLAVVFGGRAAA